MLDFLNMVSGYVWGWPLMILLVGTGLWLTFSLRALQFSHLIHAFTLIVRKTPDRKAQGDISNFEALMVALSATVGTGNIAGVATAIYIGGPGALFWMWMTGLVGMATKYAEAVLAVKYRVQNENGTFSGGPMYYISRGLGWKWLATLFAFFAAIATFGIGSMVQSNSVADALNHSFSIAPGITGIVLMGLTAAVIIGGVRSIGRVTALLVPVMIALYVLGALAVILMHITEIPGVLAMVVSSAFQPVAATGGFAGATVMMAIRLGVARGLFSNESGLGSAPIAAAAARTSQPVVQALISMTQTFIDTLVVCSMTGLVILVTGVWTSGKNGAPLTSYAFETGLPGELGGLIVTIGIILFAYSTILGWSYYGEKAIEYLLGSKAIIPYRWAFIIAVGLALGMNGVFLEPSTGEVVDWKTHRTLAGLLLFIVIGIMAGMFGLGAGWANVPVLNLLMGVPLKVSVGTSKFLLSITDTSAAWVYLNQGCVIPLMAIPSIVGLMLGSVVGVRLLAKAKPKFIRIMVIAVLFFSGAKALLKGLGW